jgi:hypothetical protein
MDDTDEFGSKEGQDAKVKSGAVETLTKWVILKGWMQSDKQLATALHPADICS